MNRDDAIMISVILPEGRGHRVQQNAALNKVIKQNSALTYAIKFAHKHFH